MESYSLRQTLRRFLIMWGGQSGTLKVFLNSVTYRPTLSKFRGGPVKKNTLYNGNDANNTLSTSDSLKGSGPVHLVGSHCVEKFAEEIDDEGEEEEEEEVQG